MFPIRLLACAGACLHVSHAQVTNFFEGFEAPLVSPGAALEVGPGSVDFDNSGWEVTKSEPGVGVFIDNNFLFVGGSQVAGFGGGNSPAPNSISIVISGFAGASLPSISFDYFGFPLPSPSQGLDVTVTDPNNGDAVLYTGDFFGNGSVTNAAFLASPSGDEVELVISQIGNTVSSDSAIDNIRLVAVPEPSGALLLVAGLGSLALRRRRKS